MSATLPTGSASEVSVATSGLIVRNARVHPTSGRSVEPVDLSIVGDVIAAVGPTGEIRADGRPELDAEGRLLSPPLVDPHVHLDAVLTVGEPRYNESGTLIEGILTWAERKPSLTHDDVKGRAREAILWEVAQGTGLIRSPSTDTSTDSTDRPNVGWTRALRTISPDVATDTSRP